MRIHSLLLGLALLGTSVDAGAEVDPDCLAGRDSFTCHQGRIADARIVDRLAQPALAKAGWAHGCFTIQYVKADNDGPDTLLVIVHGDAGGTAPACRFPPAEKLTSQEVAMVQRGGGDFGAVLKATADKSAAKGQAKAATPAQLQAIGQALKVAIRSAPSQTRDQVLRHIKYIALGNGYGGEAEVALP